MLLKFSWTLIIHEYVEIEKTMAPTAASTKANEMSKMPNHSILFYNNAVTVNQFDCGWLLGSDMKISWKQVILFRVFIEQFAILIMKVVH